MDNLTARFLWNASKLLKKTKSSEEVSSVINQLRFRSLDFSTVMPNVKKTSEFCMHCGNVWCDGFFSLHLKSHTNLNIRKRIRKIDQTSKLSKCRMNFLSFYKSHKDNILVKKCLICKSNTKNCMSKPFPKLIKENVGLDHVGNQNSMNRKRKRKSSKKQSFAGLSPAAVLQARTSFQTKVKDTSFQALVNSKFYEPTVDGSCSVVPRFVTNDSLLSNNGEKPDVQTISSTTIPQTVNQSDFSLGVYKNNVKKPKLSNDALTVTKKKSVKNKKKSFLSEVLSFL